MEKVKIKVHAMGFKPLKPNDNPFPFEVGATKCDDGYYEVRHEDFLAVGVNLSDCAQGGYIWTLPPIDCSDKRYKIEEVKND